VFSIVVARVAAALVAVGLLLYIDMETKNWAASELRSRGPRTVAGGHVRLHYQENTGIAFGHLRHGRQSAILAYSVASAVVLLAILLYRLVRRRPTGFLISGGCAALLAGTLGNLHDRLVRGFVVDFIDVTAQHRIDWPIFNVADAVISVGLVLCLAGLVKMVLRRTPPPPALA
jgi:signal peptidase II